MSDDFAARLHEVMIGLHGEAGRIERVGRALSPAEQRRAGSLRTAAELVQRAIDELVRETDEAPLTGGSTSGASTGGSTGGTSTGGPTGGMSTGGSASGTSTGGSTGGASTGGAGGYRDSDLAGDDDTPGYGLGDDDTPGYSDDERGGSGLA